MAATTTRKGGKSGVVTAVILTVVAAIGGGLTGKLIAGRTGPAANSPELHASAGAKPAPYAQGTEVRELPSIVTNLGKPAETRVRLQVAMVYSKEAVENANLLSAKISDDIVAFMQTLSVSDLQGPSGLLALREDLNERAAVRSAGKVREIIIEALVVQ